MMQIVWAVLAIVLCLLGAFTQLAVHRSPDVPDSDGVRAARRIVITALLIAVFYILDLMWNGCPISPVMSILFGLFGAGQLLYAHSTFSKHTTCDHGPHARSIR